MNDYKPSHPAAFGAIAVALTAMTIGLAVVLPAKMNAGNHEVRIGGRRLRLPPRRRRTPTRARSGSRIAKRDST
jgi:hypothetical protein